MKIYDINYKLFARKLYYHLLVFFHQLSDFLQKYLPNEKYEETNMFNLTYFITDKEGNYILEYSLDEIIIKLQGIKYWLKRNIIPLTHKILDITGVSYFTGGNYIDHVVYDIRNIKIKEDMTPITFKLN